MKGQNSKKTKAPSAPSTVNDDRFAEVYSDPRFMKVPKKVQKVKIDDRFKKALKDKEFNMVAKVDKYGKRVNKQDTTMLKYYNVEEEGDEKGENKYYDEDGKFKWEAESSSDEAVAAEEDDDSAVENLEMPDDNEDDEDGAKIWSDEDDQEAP